MGVNLRMAKTGTYPRNTSAAGKSADLAPNCQNGSPHVAPNERRDVAPTSDTPGFVLGSGSAGIVPHGDWE